LIKNLQVQLLKKFNGEIVSKDEDLVIVAYPDEYKLHNKLKLFLNSDFRITETKDNFSDSPLF